MCGKKKTLKRQQLTFQVAGLSVSESDGQILQALRQRRDHVPQQPLLLLGAVATARLQGCHSSLAPMEHLKENSHFNNSQEYPEMFQEYLKNACFEF